MSLTISSASNHATHGSGAGTIALSSALTVSLNDIIVGMVSLEDGSGVSFNGWTASTGTATVGSWTDTTSGLSANNAPAIMSWTKVTGAGTFNPTATLGGTGTAAKYLWVLQITGADGTTPVPAGKIFTGSGATGNVTQSITPTNANGSALYLWASDFNAVTLTAGTSCTGDLLYKETGTYSVGLVRPTTNPRTDGNAFTLALNETSSKTAWIAFEVVSATGGGGGASSKLLSMIQNQAGF